MKKLLIIFPVLLTIIFNSCTKDEGNGGAVTIPTSQEIDEPLQYSVEIDGNKFVSIEDASLSHGYYSIYKNAGVPPDSNRITYLTGILNNYIPNYLYIEIGTLYSSSYTASSAEYNSFFSPRSFNYMPFLVDGVRIVWRDENYQTWSTDIQGADQTGSNFTITEVERIGFVNNENIIKFKAVFNCKLYSTISGESIILTDGVYVGKVANF